MKWLFKALSSGSFQTLFEATDQLANAQYYKVELVEQLRSTLSERLEKEKALFESSQNQMKSFYLEMLRSRISLHFHSLYLDIFASFKECLLDALDQRHQQMSTILISASVLFSALSTVIIQGILSPDLHPIIFVASSCICAGSFVFLLISIIASQTVIGRTAVFAIQVVATIRQIQKECLQKFNRSASVISDQNWQYSVNNVTTFVTSDVEIEVGKIHQQFVTFWEAECQFWERLASASLYIGMSLFILSVAIYLWSEFTKVYRFRLGGKLAVILCLLSLVVSILLGVWVRFGQDFKDLIRQRSIGANSRTFSDTSFSAINV